MAAFFDGGLLKVSSDWSDPIVITTDAGFVKVNDTDPDSGPVSADKVEHLAVSGGPFGNLIDLSGVDAKTFSSLKSTEIATGSVEKEVLESAYAPNVLDDLASFASQELSSVLSTRVPQATANSAVALVLDTKDAFVASSIVGASALLESSALAAKVDRVKDYETALSQLGDSLRDWALEHLDVKTALEVRDEIVRDVLPRLDERLTDLWLVAETSASGSLGFSAIESSSSITTTGEESAAEALGPTTFALEGDGGAGGGAAMMASFVGSDLPDTIIGTSGDDTIDGGKGDDHLFGMGGNDQIDGAEGADYIEGGSGDDVIDGGEGNDLIWGVDGNDTLSGGTDSDQVFGGAGNDVLQEPVGSTFDQDGPDTLYGGSGDDIGDGAEGNDLLYGGLGADTLYGAQFDPFHERERDTLYGGDGVDELLPGSQTISNPDVVNDDPAINGDPGERPEDLPRVAINHAPAVSEDDPLGAATFDVTLIDPFNAFDDDFDVSFTTVDDSAIGAAILTDGDYLISTGSVAFTVGGASIQQIVVPIHDDLLLESDESFFVDLTAATGALLTVNRARGRILDDSDTVTVTFDSGTLNIVGDASSNVIAVDFVDVSGTNYVIVNKDGVELFDGRPGGEDVPVTAVSGISVDGLAGDDSIDLSQVTLANGFALASASLSGGDGDDDIVGSGFADSLIGGLGDDVLSGGDGDDTLLGGGGSDGLEGQLGDDVLEGGESDDVYIFSRSDSSIDLGHDTIVEQSGSAFIIGDTLDFRDFRAGVDLDLMQTTVMSALGALVLTAEGGFLESAFASPFDDTLHGNAAANWFFGEGGADLLDGRDGDDTLYAGDGDDTLLGGAGSDDLRGEEGRDLLFGGDASDTLNGGNEGDTIFGGRGNDVVDGAGDADHLYGEEGDDTLTGRGGQDLLYGNQGEDTLWGGAEADELFGGSGADLLYGEDGNDRLDGGGSGVAAGNTLDGGNDDDLFFISNAAALAGENKFDTIIDPAGIDTLDFSAWSGGFGISVDLSDDGAIQAVAHDGSVSLQIDDGGALEDLIGTLFSDDLRGNAAANSIRGLGGNDTLYASGGGDQLFGDAGDDHLYADDGIASLFGALGDDELYAGSGTGHLFGESGNDRYYVGVSSPGDDGVVRDNLYEGAGDDVYIFGPGHLGDVAVLPESLGVPQGNDTLDFSGLDAGIANFVLPDEESSTQSLNALVTLLIAGADYESGSYRGAAKLERIIGTAFDDAITGNLADNVIEAGNGSDTLHGGGGSDILLAEGGFDAPEVVDQDDAEYTETGASWAPSVFQGGFNTTQRQVGPEGESGLHTATWTFADLEAGDYEVLVTWQPDPDDVDAASSPTGASNAQFKVNADGVVSSPLFVNQRVFPQSQEVAGQWWQRLGDVFSVSAQGTLSIELSNAGADGTAFADAVLLVKHDHAPVLQAIGNQAVAGGVDLDVSISATDPDGLASELVFALAGSVPSGLVIVDDGPGSARLQWPAAGRPEGTLSVTVVVTDLSGTGTSDFETIFVDVGTPNAAPSISMLDNLVGGTLVAPDEYQVNEGIELAFDVVASDSGGSGLTYSVAPGAPTGAGFHDPQNPERFSWTPTEDQDSADPYEITIQVTDDGNPALRRSHVILVSVEEVNLTPTITSFGLLHDTVGVGTDSDWRTIDPTLTGTVINDGSARDVEILIDFENDGTFDDSVRATPSELDPTVGTFVFEASDLEFAPGSPPPPLTFVLKAQEWDPTSGTWIYSAVTAPETITPDPLANDPPSLTVELLNNLGTSGDPKSSDAIVVGTVTNPDGTVQGLSVSIYDQDPDIGSPDPIAEVTTDEVGDFLYAQRDLAALDTDGDGLVSVSVWFIAHEQAEFGDFSSDTVAYTYTLVLNETPRIESLALLHDTGVSDSDGITSALTVVGSISHSDGVLGGVTIEFDDDNDGNVDGVAITDELGEFRYRPIKPSTLPGGLLDARVAEWDSYRDQLLESPWLDDPQSTHLDPLPLVYDEAANDAPRVTSIGPLYPNPGGDLADPTVWGTVINDDGFDVVAIEFSFAPINVATGHFDTLAGVAAPDDAGQFEFTPAGLEAETSYTLYVRAVEWDDTLPVVTAPLRDQLLFDNSAVLSMTFALAPFPLAINSYAGATIAFDTGSGADASNGETSDPTLEGTVTYAGSYSQLTVEFDHDGDGIVDGETVPNDTGEFRYLPAGLTDGDVFTIRSRVRAPDFVHRPAEFDDGLLDAQWYTTGYDPITQSWDPVVVDAWFDTIFTPDKSDFDGEWSNSDFEIDWDDLISDQVTAWQETIVAVDLSENDAPAVVSLSLANPATPSLDPTVSGSIANDGNVEGLLVEFYLNGSSLPDGSAITNAAGEFEYALQSHTTGANDIIVRIFEPSYDGATSYADSAPYSVTIDPDSDLVIESLELKSGEANGSGGFQAVDPTLIGAFSAPTEASGLVLRFDYDGDGVAEAEVPVGGLRQFEFTPENLLLSGGSPVTTTVRVQLAGVVPGEIDGDSYVTLSDWASLTWDVINNAAPSISRFELLHDTGNVGLGYEVLDRVTTDPTLVGRLQNDNGVSFLTVEFDHDGDLVPDGTTVSDENGDFLYLPQELTIGSWDIRARVLEYDPATGTQLDSGWQQITRDGDPASVSAFYGFTLLSAQQATSLNISHSGSTYDPTITGTVTDADGTANLIVEFFVDGASEPIGSTPVSTDGTFAFTPIGLPFGAYDISAEVREWNYATGAELPRLASTSPVSITFASISSGLYLSDLGKVNPGNPFDPTIMGIASADKDLSLQYVEVDVNGDGTVEATVSVQFVSLGLNTKDYRFTYHPELPAEPGSVSIHLRPVALDDSGYVFGAWQTTNVTYDPILPSIDSGWTISDDNTSRPTIEGDLSAATTSGATAAQDPVVEFDIDGDGVVDETVLAGEGLFGVYPFSHTFNDLPPGDLTIQARVVRYELVDDDLDVANGTIERIQTIVGDWQSLEFTLIDPAPRVTNIALANEVGGAAPLETTDPAIEGIVESDGTSDLYALTVEVDHDADGIADGIAVTDAGGAFYYSPTNLSPGTVTLRVRAVDPYTGTQQLTGQWADFTFTLLATPPPTVTALELAFDQGDGTSLIASLPTFIGNVTRHESVSVLTVEFDHDGDGLVDGSTTADALGNFSYDALRLAYGANSIRARGVALAEAEVVAGEWSAAVDFFFASTEAPFVSDLKVLDTSSGQISGRVTVDGFGAAATVEVAVVVGPGPRVTNGYATSDPSGFFVYTPVDLAAGAVDLDVRALLSDPTATNLIEGDWQSLASFNYAPDPLPGTPPVISDFRLAYDTGQNDADGLTADPRVVGSVDFASPLLSIEFSEDGGATVAASVPVASDGTFEWTPSDLNDLESVTLHVRYRLWDPFFASPSLGQWTDTIPVSFTLDVDENDAPTLVSLQLEQGSLSSNGVHNGPLPVFSGQIDNDGVLGGLVVQFDHDQDGVFEGSAVTREDGSFLYLARDVSASTQQQFLTARVFESGYLGEEVASENDLTISFLLEEAPLVDQLDYDPDAGTDGQILGTVVAPSLASTHVEYQLFGNYDNAPPIPTQLTDFVPNDPLLTASIDGSGNFTIDLAPFALGLGSASVVARAVDPTNDVAGGWKLLSFVVAPPTVVALSISSFQLIEDTGTGTGSDTDGLTSNPTVEGIVGSGSDGAYAVVEITIDDGSGPENEVRRVVADAVGRFEFTPESLPIGQAVTLEARHVAYDADNDQELFGTPSTAAVTLLNNNDTATILSFGLVNDLGSGTVDPTVSGTILNDGRIAGLRVEFDVDGDEEVDGFAFSDASGQFVWTPYSIPSGQQTTVRARVVEWDGVLNDYVAAPFADQSSASVTFTLAQDGPTDPSLDEDFAADLTAIEHAESEAQTAVVAFAASIGIAGATAGSIDVGIGSVTLLHRAGAETLDEDGDFSSPAFDFVPNQLPAVESTTVTDQGIVSFNTGVGVLTGEYDYTKTVVVTADTIIIDIVYHVDFDDYHSEVVFSDSSDGVDSVRTVTLDMSGSYHFEYHASANYTDTGTIDIVGSHTLDETLEYDYLRKESATFSRGTEGNSSANSYLYVTLGDYSYDYDESSSTYADGLVTQPFSYVESNRLETWRLSSSSESSRTAESSSSSHVSEAEHTLYIEDVSNTGTITVTSGDQVATGTLQIDASGSLNSNRDESSTHENNYGSGNKDSGSFSRVDGVELEASLGATIAYTTGSSSDAQFSYTETLASTVGESGSGHAEYEGENFFRTEFWSYDVDAALDTDFNSGGTISTRYSDSGSTETFSIAAVQDVAFNLDGSSRAGADYSNTYGDVDESGSVTGSASWSASSKARTNATADGTDDDSYVVIDGTLNYSSDYQASISGEGSWSSATEDNTTQTRVEETAASSGSADYRVVRSIDELNSTGTFESSVNATSLSASQSHGTETVPDGEGGDVTVPFRTNRTERNATELDLRGEYGSTQSFGEGTPDSSYLFDGTSRTKHESETKSSDFRSIEGESTGFGLTKSTTSSTEETNGQVRNDNGDIEQNKVTTRHAEGSNDTLIVLTSSVQSGATTTDSSSRVSSGSDYRRDSTETFIDDGAGRLQSGAYDEELDAHLSSRSTTVRQSTQPENLEFETSTSDAKFTSQGTASGSYFAEDDILKTRSATADSTDTARISVNGISFARRVVESGNTTTYTTEGSSGNGRSAQNGAVTTTVRFDGNDTTTDSAVAFDSSATLHATAYTKETESTRVTGQTDRVVTSVRASTRIANDGEGSGDINQASAGRTYDFDVQSDNAGERSITVSVAVVQQSDARSEGSSVRRQDTVKSQSNFDGNLRDQGNGLRRSGDVDFSSSNETNIDVESFSNSKNGNKKQWTQSTAGFDVLTSFTFDGELPDDETVASLAGSATLIEQTTVRGSETEGWRETISGGYDQKVVTTADSVTDRTTTDATVTFEDGERTIQDESVTPTKTTTLSVTTSRNTRSNNTLFEHVHHHDGLTVETFTIVETTDAEGQPSYTEIASVRSDIQEKDIYENDFSTHVDRRVVVATDIERDDWTRFTTSGDHQRIKTFSRHKETVTADGTNDSLPFEQLGFWVLFDPTTVDLSDYHYVVGTTEFSEYESSHDLTEDGLEQNGQFNARRERTRTTETDGTGLSIASFDISFKQNFKTYEIETEHGIYTDAREDGVLRRLTRGQFTEETGTEVDWEYDTVDAPSDNSIDYTHVEHRSIAGDYDRNGGTERVTDNSVHTTYDRVYDASPAFKLTEHGEVHVSPGLEPVAWLTTSSTTSPPDTVDIPLNWVPQPTERTFAVVDGEFVYESDASPTPEVTQQSDVEFVNPWWEGLRAGLRYFFVDEIYDSAQSLVTGEIFAGENAEADDYLRQSLNQVVLGDYSDDVTALGTGVSLAAGLTGVDIAADIRDLSANIVDWEFTWRHAGVTALNVVGLLPLIGALKNADEVGQLAKSYLKKADFAETKKVDLPDAASNTVNPSRIELHHSDPKFLGGDPNQLRTPLPRVDHVDLHRDLNKFLRDKTDAAGNHMRPQRGNSAERIAENFTRQERLEAEAEFYKLFRDKYPDAARDFFNQHPDLE